MIGRIAFAVRLFIFWLVFFALSRLVFLAYHFKKWQTSGFTEVLKTFFYGLKLDVSAAGYLLAIPLLLILLSIFIKPAKLRLPLKIYHVFVIFLISLINTADLQLYREWGTKINVQALQYLKFPKEALASVSSSPVGLLLFIFAFLLFSGVGLYWFIARPQQFEKAKNIIGAQKLLALLLILAAFFFDFLAIRGGLQLAAINQSTAYFSSVPFLNHASLNTGWNLFYTIDNNGARVDLERYQYMPGNEAEAIVKELYKLTEKTPEMKVLVEKRPNIVFIVLESWTADVIASLGAEPGITPEFEKLIKNGLLFDSIYASGDRTDKGLLAVLSGFPSQPATSIITQPEKFEKLPSVARSLIANGYNSSFYYGGESEFANIKAYMISAGFGKIIDKNNFSKAEMNSKWGAHDHILFDKVIKELEGQKKPFFATVLTLSSHEPFEIPIPSKYKGIEERNKFKSSVFYTDKSLGGFFENAKSQPWYANTLFVLVADHGHRLPKEYPELYNPGKYRIPLLFYGDVLKKEYRGKRINKVGSQTDIAAMLLAQLSIENNEFAWSKNLLNPKVKEFAFYDFNDGFGWVSPQGPLVFDNINHNLIWNKTIPGTRQDSLLIQGKAYMQQLMSVYSSY